MRQIKIKSKNWKVALTAASVLAVGCGNDGRDVRGGEKPWIESVDLARVQIMSSDALAMLHPVKVEVDLQVSGEPFSTDVNVGLQADDGRVGCVLGSMEAAMEDIGRHQLELRSEFFVNGDCADLIGRDDIELFVSFDPREKTDMDRPEPSDDDTVVMTMEDHRYELARRSMLSMASCVDCSADVELHESPGVDAELREVGLGSSVSVIQLPASEEQTELPDADTPHFNVSTTLRVAGVPKNAELSEGESFITHRIRPEAGAPGTDALGPESLAWTVLEQRQTNEGGHQYAEEDGLDLRGQIPTFHASAAYIPEALIQRMNNGDLRHVEHFEVETCVGTSFEQANSDGDARGNDCAVLPVAVVRDWLGPNGEHHRTRGEALALGATAQNAQSWSPGEWKGDIEIFGKNYHNSVGFEAWLDVNATDETGKTYDGISIPQPGSWFEAGAKSEATVFNVEVTLLKTAGAVASYRDGGGLADVEIRFLHWKLIDSGFESEEAFELSLQQVFDAVDDPSGDDDDDGLETMFSAEYPVAGYSFDDHCYTIEAAVLVEGEVGLDAEETTLSIGREEGNPFVQAKIYPRAGINLVSSIAAEYEGYGIELGAAFSASLTLLSIGVPLTARGTFYPFEGALGYELDASVEFNTLSGSIDYEFKYDLCALPIFDWLADCEGTHEGTLLEWDGFTSDPISLWSKEDKFVFGEAIPTFCEEWNGETIRLETPGGSVVAASSDGSVSVHSASSSSNDNGFTVDCDGDEVRFRSVHGDYLRAGDEADLGPSSDGATKLEAVFQDTDGEEDTWSFGTSSGKYLAVMGEQLSEWDHPGQGVFIMTPFEPSDVDCGTLNVSGLHMGEFNGDYSGDGTYGGEASYSNGSGWIFKRQSGEFEGQWVIDKDPPSEEGAVLVRTTNSPDNPWDGDWHLPGVTVGCTGG